MTSSFGTSPTGAGPAAPVEIEDRIVEAVLTVPGVVAMHGGTFGEAATYLPGRRVSGVRINDQGTDVHVTVLYGSVVRTVAEQVRRAVAAVSPGPVQVTVEDLVPALEPVAWS
ncbi:MAG: Asp23/Gls24 family envelope stress response protein [Mycobacteriaceae bacterium]